MLLYNAEKVLRKDNEVRWQQLLPEHQDILDDMQIYLIQKNVAIYDRAAILHQFVEIAEKAKERKDTMAHVAGGDLHILCDEYIAAAIKEPKSTFWISLMTVFSAASFALLTMTFLMNCLVGLIRYGKDGFTMDIQISVPIILSILGVVVMVMAMVSYMKHKVVSQEPVSVAPVYIIGALLFGIVVVFANLWFRNRIIFYGNYAILAAAMAMLYLVAEFLTCNQANHQAAKSKIGS